MSIIEIKRFDGKIVGWFDTESKTYNRKTSVAHRMRMFDGSFGMSLEPTRTELNAYGCEWVIIDYKGSEHVVYKVAFEEYMKDDKIRNYEGDPQSFVSIADMEIIG